MSLFQGSAVALVTPFHPDGSVNYEKLAELVEWQIAEGTDAIVACGTTGESSTLDNDEHLAVIECVIKQVGGRVPVIAGTGSNDTAFGVWLSKEAEKLGADALLVVTPYYNKPTQKGLIQNFTAIADAVNIPVILYNVPGRTGVNIDPPTVAELAKHPNICALKEASGNISQVAEIARLVPEDFDLYSGNDDMIVPLMSLGGKGVISVLANIAPRKTHEMAAAYLNGNPTEACKLQLELKPLIDALFCESNPIPVKTALNLMGKNAGPLRLPLTDMADHTLARLSNELKAAGLISQEA